MSIKNSSSHMKEYRILAAVIAAILLMSGCAEIPLKDGELVIGKNTTAGLDNIGVGHLSGKF